MSVPFDKYSFYFSILTLESSLSFLLTTSPYFYIHSDNIFCNYYTNHINLTLIMIINRFGVKFIHL